MLFFLFPRRNQMTIQNYFKGILEWSNDFKRVWMGLTDRRKMVKI